MIIRALIASVLVLALASPAPPAAAQVAAARGRLLVTIADPSGAIIPTATVVVTREDGEASARVPRSTLTSAEGVAVFDGLASGGYTVVASFSGFETVTVRGQRVGDGDSRRRIVLPIQRVAEDLVVGRDSQTAGLDPRGSGFSTVLTREQIEALPDDPDEMEAALRAMAPPGAKFKVDGFTGGKLPPKSQIKSIRLPNMDQMAAQYHGGMSGMMHIEIMTKPGGGPVRGSVDVTFRDDALNARNPFTPSKGDEGLRQGGLSLSGGIVPDRSSFSLTVQRGSIFESGTLLAARPGSTVASAVRQPTDRLSVHARFDQSLPADHSLRVIFAGSDVRSRNLGVGGFDLPERAFSTESTDRVLRISESGALGRRFLTESRLQLRWSDNTSVSAVETPTIRVLDAFTTGGAQRRGGRRALEFEAASDLDYVRGAHAFRTGVLVEGGRYTSDDFTNYLGTFTFASLADFEAGRPATFTRRVGDPVVRYSNVQVGVYAQDDYRVSRSLLLSYGVRYEAQSLVSDRQNLSPRLSVSWSPLKSGRTTFRGGMGYFTDWLGTGVHEQALRVDGFRQREVNMLNPAYPEAGLSGITPPTNRYLLDDGLALPESFIANAGIDQQLTGAFRVSGTYTYRRGTKVLRGRNLNAPVDGIRPDPAFANVVEVVNDADARFHSLSLSGQLMKLDWRQTFVMMNYSLTSSGTNATGPFGVPATGDDLSGEWGPTAPRHRGSVSFNMKPAGGLGVAVNLRAQSGQPYNITTGRDDNRDGLFNDRPAGVERNAARTAAQWDVGLRLSYAIAFGNRSGAAGPGATMIMVGGAGGGMPGGLPGGSGDKRFRLEFYVAAQNVTNRANYVGYSGVLTSPFFRRPTNVMNPRKVELGMRFGF